MHTGDRIRAEREAKGWSQARLGRAVHVSRAAVSQWEIGTTKGLKPEHLVSVAEALDVTVEWLVCGDRYPKPRNGSTTGDARAPANNMPALDLKIVSWVFENMEAVIGKLYGNKSSERVVNDARPEVFSLLYRYAARDKNVMTLSAETVIKLVE